MNGTDASDGVSGGGEAGSSFELRGVIIQRGGERFTLEKSPDHFAVRRRAGTVRGALAAARQKPDEFLGLEYEPTQSTTDVEVYRINPDSLEQAMEALRAESSEVVWCSHVYHMPGDPEGLMVSTDAIYVEFAPGAEPEEVNRLLDEHKLELMPAGDGDPNAFVARLTAASTENPIKIANGLLASAAVTLAEPDFSMGLRFTAYRPSDPLFADQWHLENRGGFGLTAGADIRAPDAWEVTRGDRSVVVCVMDDGVQVDHPDFVAAGKIVSPYDFGLSQSDPTPKNVDDNHGTACAGVAVAEENGGGVVGVAPRCALMPVRTSASISNQTIKDLFDYARVNGAHVVSCSWGVNAKFFTLSTPMANAIERAAREGRGGRGCVIVFAAGNEDSPVDGTKGGVPVRSGFALHPDVIAVSASNSHDRRSDYSNYGAQIWVSAPSSGSGGRRIVTTDRTGAAGYQSGDYTTTNGFGGTSSSTPLVAGVCALMLSANPGLTGAEVRDILRETSDGIDTTNGAYDVGGHSDWYGYGRVNADRAVREAQRRLAPVPVRRVAFERTPALPIPDLNPAGVGDTIVVPDAATVRAVEVSVDISHTYRGDLVVRLVAPDGRTAVVHDRAGGSQDNLVATFSTATTPGLAAFVGASALGSWTLQVTDLARLDTGTVNSWSLSLELEGGPRTEWEATPGLIIPDNDPQGIVSELVVEGSGALKDIELTVDINHTWRGDLRVALESPGGVTAEVQGPGGGGAQNLKQTYRPAEVPALKALVDAGVGIQGVWRLRVADRASRDVGKLNAWKLKLTT
ncbi:MAG: proprotein convertase P-domain-containing protein [Actinobacteria bacterium]|nr:proprotein convertase P-domain-containing protein [Actinomycetota bacterium]